MAKTCCFIHDGTRIVLTHCQLVLLLQWEHSGKCVPVDAIDEFLLLFILFVLLFYCHYSLFMFPLSLHWISINPFAS